MKPMLVNLPKTCRSALEDLEGRRARLILQAEADLRLQYLAGKEKQRYRDEIKSQGDTKEWERGGQEFGEYARVDVLVGALARGGA